MHPGATCYLGHMLLLRLLSVDDVSHTSPVLLLVVLSAGDSYFTSGVPDQSYSWMFGYLLTSSKFSFCEIYAFRLLTNEVQLYKFIFDIFAVLQVIVVYITLPLSPDLVPMRLKK